MGDGRYYTTGQFINTGILTISIMINVLVITYLYIKRRKGFKNDALIIFVLLNYGFLVLLFLDGVIFNLKVSMLIKSFIFAIFTMENYIWIQYIVNKNTLYEEEKWNNNVEHIGNIKIQLKRTIIKKWILVGCMISLFFALNPLHRLFFEVYDYEDLKYNDTHYLIMFTGIFIFVVYIFYDISKSRSDSYRLRTSLILNFAVLSHMLSFYGWTINGLNLKFHIYASPFVIILIFITTRTYMPEFLLPTKYGDYVEELGEIIIVTNQKGKIMFCNKKNLDLDLKFSISKLMPENIVDLFEKYVFEIIDEDAEKLDIKVFSDITYYYHIEYEKLIYKNNNKGYIYIIYDRTYLFHMIKELGEKNKQLEALNLQLGDYANNVEELNSEKERTKLLYDVQEIVGHSMAELIKMLQSIEDLDKDEPYFIHTLENSISKGRETLKIVRKTVENFRKSYEVKAND